MRKVLRTPNLLLPFGQRSSYAQADQKRLWIDADACEEKKAISGQ